MRPGLTTLRSRPKWGFYDLLRQGRKDSMSKQIAVIGSQGQLGWELCRQLGPQAIALSRSELDITNPAEILRVLTVCQPTAVINTAAYTKVDLAEKEPDACHLTNATAVGCLAEVCQRLECPLVQVSTDYVFGAAGPRDRPYTEDEPTEAHGEYARSKLAGEQRAAENPRHFIVRTCGLYGYRHKPSLTNFVDTMLRLGRQRDELRVVGDQHCTPSYVPHVARAILFLLDTDAYGTYHVVNAGATTWFDFAAEIFRQAGIQIRLQRITTEEYGAAAPRPSYSVLDTGKYHALGGPAMPSWQDALAEYLQKHVSP
jgi:dTDP-4-dehydrorhamnose reductase